MKFEKPHLKDKLTEEQMNYFTLVYTIYGILCFVIGVILGITI